MLPQVLIFVPLLYVAGHYAGPGVLSSAAWGTMLGFAGLTGIAFLARKDLPFLGGLLRWGGVVAIVLIVAEVLFGFPLGTLVFVGMIGLAGGAILYDTSSVLHHYPDDRYVGAALARFASVARRYGYVLQLFLSRG